ncbi:hypothetical protein [Kriegella aquimaris]|uniref:Tetratricopeptide repeat-containing protein n=1 Tax=Kriegella aquimaris TaxID=192904 RepID=A0A1G9MHD5_9FLAO|nr:hypothetical protein [Kriegella aquimaris]SDL73686.1 hypothetical protein SAMN04488514_102528 [Kriegella aquimaris]
MKVQDFTYLLQNPNKVVSPVQTKHLEDILEEYPYFQAAKALHLKGLKNLNSFKYNKALKITAAYTTDRDILFDFITSDEFLQNSIADTIAGKTTPLVDQEIISEEIVTVPENAPATTASTEPQISLTPEDAEQILDPKLFKSKDPEIDKKLAEESKAKQQLQIGKPLPFTKKEKYSFAEWLQLTSPKAIQRNKEENAATSDKEEKQFTLEEEVLKKKKFELIDKFIEDNPKIAPIAKEDPYPKIDIKPSIELHKKELMTETLAKVYLEQKKYKKAIQSYKILSLKYPEKSGFFADRIRAVEKLQKENK